MSETAEKTDPALWEKVKEEITAGAKGGKKGQWSARKAQMAVAEYKKRGGGYAGEKDPHALISRAEVRLDGYGRFLDDYQPEFLEVEQTVVNNTVGYAGTRA